MEQTVNYNRTGGLKWDETKKTVELGGGWCGIDITASCTLTNEGVWDYIEEEMLK